MIRKILFSANKRQKEKVIQENKKNQSEIPDDDYGVEFLKFQENRREETGDDSSELKKEK